jgi:YVTN family beta-propeller protein
MRFTARSGVIGLVLCALVSACHDGGGPTEPIVPPNGTRIDLASPGSNACKPPKVHPAGKIIGTVSAPSPWDVAVRDDGAAYFTELFSNGVGITNTATRTISGFIPTGSLPTGIAMSPDGTRIYTANQGDNTVTAIDAVNNVVVGTVTIAASPFSVEVSPDNTQLFVGNNDNTMTIVDIASLQITKTVTIGFATNGFAVDPTGRFLYANSFVSASVSEIDIVTGNVLRTFTLGGTTQGMALNKKGTHLFVANQAGYITDIDLRSGQPGAQYPIAGVGFGVGVTPDDHDAWITLPLDGKVQVFNLQNHKVSATLNVGGEPRRVSFSDAGKIGAITNMAGYVTFVQ